MHKYDAVWSMMASYNSIAALFVSWATKLPLMLTLQEGDPFEHIRRRARPILPLYLLLFKRAARIQTISTYLRTFAQAMGAKCPITVVPNAVDYSHFSRAISTEVRTQTRARFLRGGQDTILITTSRLVEKNGIADIISSLSSLPPEVVLVIAGIGPLEKELIRHARTIGVEGRVHFVGYVSHAELPALVQSADVFIRPSLSEGFGNSFIEAMAARVPVIATPVGGIVDFLRDGQTGLFCEVQNPRSIADQVQRLQADPTLRARLITNAERMVREKYDWSVIVDSMKRTFFEPVFRRVKKPLKLVIATGIYPPDVGGPAQYAKHVEMVWREHGHKVSVVSFRLERSLPTGIRHMLYFVRVLPRMIGADAVLALDTFSAAFPATCAARLLNVPITIRTGGDFVWEWYVERTGDLVLLKDFYQTRQQALSAKEKLIYRASRWTLRAVNTVVFSTEWQRDIFIKAYGINPKKTALVENYIGPKQHSFEPVTKNFIAATRPLKWKNEARVRAAFARPEVVQSGAFLDTERKQFDQFMDHMASCYAVILASLGDISPNMILDAIRHNKPFIVTRENGITERIKDCAIFVDPENEADIAEKIVWLSNPTNYAAQKAKVEAFTFQHSWEEIADELLAHMKRS
jgi:glycosyltransferase involved in cell wall biosynthesis